MPELPEVETTLQGIKPHIAHQVVEKVIIRQHQLRWPIPADLNKKLAKQTVLSLARRNKYLLIEFATGTLIIHLGMSGKLCVLDKPISHKKHDHVEIHFKNKKYLRFTDPRRFGAILWHKGAINLHPLLAEIGPEPLTAKFNANYLFKRSRTKKVAVKPFIMDGKVVAGVGNIYATEALFLAGIHPKRAANELSLGECEKLVVAIKKVLRDAIKKGGTTLKDFAHSGGMPGYFSIELKVYGRGGQACVRCGNELSSIRLGQRSTVFCCNCQE